MKFCESCGAKIDTGPVCPGCGAQLLPGVKFCESCGKAVAPQGPPAPAETPPAELAAVAASPAETKQPEAKPEPEPEKKPAEAAPVKQAIKETQKETGIKKPIPQTTIFIAGVLVLALLGAAVYLVVLPMMSGSGSSPVGGNAPSPPGTAGPAGTSSSAQPAAPAAAPVSFNPEPTQIPPANLLVTFQADRDPITGIVTVTFTGGAGRYGVKDVDIRLTRSDGQVIARTVTIGDIGTGLTLQGTKTGDDRIEVTANYSNGDHYRIIDKILEYKRRNW